MSKITKLGIFGGSFDPPHIAHIQIARRAQEALGLDKVLLVVAGNPYQKKAAVSAEDRYQMTKLAAEDVKGLEVSRIEVDRVGNSYTIDTVEELLAADSSKELWLIMGADALLGIRTWHRWEALLKAVKICVVPRPCYSLKDALSIPVKMGTEVFVLELESPYRYSSTSIRRALAEGKRPEGLHPRVASYIEKRRLYRIRDASRS